MCLIVLARDIHPDYPLILLAHRDEFSRRPTSPLGWWPDLPILAGRDEQAGGTWLGISRDGRFAAVTNVREGLAEASTRSRGELVVNWLVARSSDSDKPTEQQSKALQYSGFNLLFGGWTAGQLRLSYSSNRFPPRAVPAGISALSNGDFDAPWPKARRAKATLHALLCTGATPEESWLDTLADSHQAADHELPDTGIGQEKERWLSPLLITGPHYGTRAATLLTVRSDGQLRLVERSLNPALAGQITGTQSHELMLA